MCTSLDVRCTLGAGAPKKSGLTTWRDSIHSEDVSISVESIPPFKNFSTKRKISFKVEAFNDAAVVSAGILTGIIFLSLGKTCGSFVVSP